MSHDLHDRHGRSIKGSEHLHHINTARRRRKRRPLVVTQDQIDEAIKKLEADAAARRAAH